MSKAHKDNQGHFLDFIKVTFKHAVELNLARLKGLTHRKTPLGEERSVHELIKIFQEHFDHDAISKIEDLAQDDLLTAAMTRRKATKVLNTLFH